jgi:hypothetical protein
MIFKYQESPIFQFINQYEVKYLFYHKINPNY